MTTSEILELAAENLQQAQAVREWTTHTPPEVQQRAIDTEIKCQWVFNVLLKRVMQQG